MKPKRYRATFNPISWLDRYYLGWEGMSELVETYKFYLGHIGDQDWLTLFGMAAPDLVYPLSCLYNRQINEEYDQA